MYLHYQNNSVTLMLWLYAIITFVVMMILYSIWDYRGGQEGWTISLRWVQQSIITECLRVSVIDCLQVATPTFFALRQCIGKPTHCQPPVTWQPPINTVLLSSRFHSSSSTKKWELPYFLSLTCRINFYVIPKHSLQHYPSPLSKSSKCMDLSATQMQSIIAIRLKRTRECSNF